MASAISHLGRVLSRLKTAEIVKVSKCISQSRLFHLQNANRAVMKVDMPSLSPTMSEGSIIKWHKKEGDMVAPGDDLCDIQTDKAMVTLDTDEEGILAKIIIPENTTDIKVGTLIAVMVEEGDDWQNVQVPTDAVPPAPGGDQPVQETAGTPTEPTTTVGPIGPSVRKLMEEYNLFGVSVPGTGPHGRLTKGDILNYIKAKSLSKQTLPVESVQPTEPAVTTSGQAVPPAGPPRPLQDIEGAEFIDFELTSMRKTIAKRLTQSKTTIPHAYISVECNLGAVTKMRNQLKSENVKVSVNDFIIKASAIALQRVPCVNSVWQGDTAQSSPAVDVSVAVATDQGLITPIVKSAAHLPVDEISSTVRELAMKAREGKLQLHEFQGGSFTISNLGMFGISEFTAVINPPQTAIMAVGASRLVVSSEGKPQTNLTVSLSYDSRVIDETEASRFLEVWRDVMENPSFMISGSPKSQLAADFA
ncbi:pyruvate dehydrogenase protein X component-like [Mizuhopecten yessoensis]|uniref:Dihydrolipoamide acetyltransferase component of pyruvate dehydrogenase complex n=1 Tax=Mizuhopecten yessoensis TaxID=6573 RepID=A0A210Q8A7_MIZYE|nr:pyruvate dehydrogenase protein X component-like [Mizuhopecten yessoensis]OWF44961.1 Pyruvate dehydrogenase protein X component, mitochondrial [Mizuhopecten yessoensis]